MSTADRSLSRRGVYAVMCGSGLGCYGQRRGRGRKEQGRRAGEVVWNDFVGSFLPKGRVLVSLVSRHACIDHLHTQLHLPQAAADVCLFSLPLPPSARLKGVWASSKRPSARWVPIPLGLGALVVGALEYQRNWQGGRRRDRADVGMAEDGDEMIVRVRGPWQVSPSLFYPSLARKAGG